MDLFQLEVFMTVAREGSFSRAAEKLYRTQPAVSQAIRKLEREVGESLFDRSSRDGTLTDAGQLLHEYAQKLLNLRSEAHVALLYAANVFTEAKGVPFGAYAALVIRSRLVQAVPDRKRGGGLDTLCFTGFRQ